MAKRFPLVSIIVPIYEVEQYLRCCLDSLVEQTYDNLEIILVNDGSPDNCRGICKEYLEKDPRIIYIEQSNHGLSEARNMGMRHASGDFVLFVDSDDWTSVYMVDTLVNLAIEYDAKFVAGNYDRVRDGDSPKKAVPHDSKVKIFTGPEYTRLMARPMGVFCFAWNRLIHRSLLEGVSFPVGFIFEDIFTMPQIAYRCDKVISTTEILYHYRIRHTSLSHRRFSLKALHEMDAYLDLIEHAKIWQDRKIQLYAASFFVTKYHYYHLKMLLNHFDVKQYRDCYRKSVISCWRILLSLGLKN